jgi:tetratricopeptide (TPR) repeat protein
MENEIKKILTLFKSEDFNNAIRKAKILSRKNPKNSFLKNLIGSAFLQINNTSEAIKNFELSINLSPNNIAPRNNLANAYKIKGEYKLAEKCYQKIIGYAPNYVLALTGYGSLKITLNETDGAIKLLKKSISIKSDNYVAHFNLATAYQTVGKYTEALNHAKLSIKNNSSFTPADKLISSLIKYSKNDLHFLNMKKKLNDEKISLLHKVYLHFGIAKAYEDMKDSNKFIEHIKEGNKIRKKLSGYNVTSHINLINKIKSGFKDINYSKIMSKSNNKNIIFILGMPRSGSTLLEKMLSSHKKILGAGELPFLKQLFSEKILDDFFINDTSLNLNDLADDYIRKTEAFKGDQEFIIDKNPLNFIYIGFIKILFPSAKIIHMKRDAKDTCFSCYKQLFENINFADNEQDLAKFYKSYDELMIFWKKEIKNFIYTVNYEDLVDEPESNIRKVLDFCGLKFEKECLNFNENNSPINTMSVMQARKPVYKSSISSYKRYEKDLSLLFNNLS